MLAYFAFSIESFGISSDFGALVYIGIVIFGGLLVYYLEKWFTKFFKISDNTINLYAFYGAAIAGIGFAFVSRIIIQIYNSMYPLIQYSDNLILLFFVFYVALLLSLAFEKISREVAEINPHHSKKQEKILNRFTDRVKFIVYEVIGLLIITLKKRGPVLLFLVMYFAISSLIFEKVIIIQYIFWLVSIISLSFLIIPFLRSGKTDFSNLEKSNIDEN